MTRWQRLIGPKGTEGGALIETAIAIPLLAVILLGTIDFGRVAFTALAVTQAAREGAQYGAQSVVKALDDDGIRSAANEAATDVPGFSVTPRLPHQHFCMCFTGGVESASNCTTVCTGQLRVYVEVTGTATFTTITSFPGIPHSLTVTRTVQMRAQ